MIVEPVQVVVYDAPASRDSSCACGCGGHHQQGSEGDPLAGVSLEMQTRALALTLDASFPGQVRVEYINVLADPRGPSLPQTALLCSLSYPSPLVYINGYRAAVIVDRIWGVCSPIFVCIPPGIDLIITGFRDIWRPSGRTRARACRMIVVITIICSSLV